MTVIAEQSRGMGTWRGPWGRYVVGVLGALAAALLLFRLLMQPSLDELRLMALFLSATAVVSVGAGYAAYRLGWVRRAPRLGWTLLAGYALSTLLTFINVWVTARLMFASQHDLALATVLLFFAGGIAMSLGYFLSVALSSHIERLNLAAVAIAGGDLSARVSVEGRDELADLAVSFNEMAARLEDAEQRRQEVEQLRRDLIAWVGHDLRTPLASIRAIVEGLADGVIEEPAQVERYLRTAQQDITSLSTLIDDLFEMAQLDAGGIPLDRHPHALSDLLTDTLDRFRPIASRSQITLSAAVPTGIDPIPMDVPKIGRVLVNLVSNAIRHTPAGGTIHLAARSHGESVVVEVGDSGEGIADADLPHIFESFYRGEKSRSRRTGGSGLGLAIAERIVAAHGGTIEAESRQGQGTTIRFRLPRSGLAPD